MVSNKMTLLNKEQGSYCFTMQCESNAKLIAVLPLFRIVVLFEEVADKFADNTSALSCDIMVARHHLEFLIR